ncbi:MAG: hypothetical protein ACYSQZ_03990 [Planctomycetota bacterium]
MLKDSIINPLIEPAKKNTRQNSIATGSDRKVADSIPRQARKIKRKKIIRADLRKLAEKESDL